MPAQLCSCVSWSRPAVPHLENASNSRSGARIFVFTVVAVLLSLETFAAQPARGDLADWRQAYPDGSYAGIYYLTPQPLEGIIQTVA